MNKPLNRYIVTIKTTYRLQSIPVRAESSADALLKLADRIPVFCARVPVHPAA